MSNVIHTQSKKQTNNTIKIMEIKYWVNFLKLIVTCYIAVCLKCYAWPWTHFYSIIVD